MLIQILISIIASIIIAITVFVWDKYISKSIPSLANKWRKNVNLCLSSKDFIYWRDSVLEIIYGSDFFTEEFGSRYPCHIIPVKKTVFPFNDILGRLSYDNCTIYSNSEYSPIALEDEPVFHEGGKRAVRQKKLLLWFYRRLVGPSIKHPNLIGFCLDNYDTDPNSGIVERINTKLGYYENNVYTSHILEFELYDAYRKLKGRIPERNDIWRHLPFRLFIHKNCDKDALSTVLYSGDYRTSLLSIQVILLFKNKKEDATYNTLLIKRSDDPNLVSAKLGFYQFVPAGGFELYDKDGSQTKEIIEKNYSLTMALFREYLEEAFNLKEFEDEDSSVNKDPLSCILSHKEYKRIEKDLETGLATLDLLGISIDLVSLRHEISFLLKIDDPMYSLNDFNPNYEYKRGKLAISRSFEGVYELLSKEENQHLVHHSSAALYHMTKEFLLRK